MCNHNFFCSEYSTIICCLCGLERETSLSPSEGYTENIPLELGYSRYYRMQALMNRLFQPTLYGSPNSRVVFEVLQQNFTNGVDLLAWLSKLSLKNKRYQNTHYYFAVHNKAYRVPDPPSKGSIRKMLTLFSRLEHWFEKGQQIYKSFFSYNWLLRFFLKKYQLEVYLPFVKTIKCRKRVAMYETMFELFTNADNAAIAEDVSRMNQKQLVSLPGDVHSSHLVLRRVLGRSTKNLPNNWASAT